MKNSQATLFQELVAKVTYIYNTNEVTEVYMQANPASGTVLLEFTGAKANTVKNVQSGVADPSVLWQNWTPGVVGVAGNDIFYGPWSCCRITATNAYVCLRGY